MVMVLFPWQTFQIPTMQNGPDLAKRFYKELTDIQVRAEGAAWRRQTRAASSFLQLLDLVSAYLRKKK